MNIGIISAFVIYTGLLGILSLLFYAKKQNASSFLLGSRSANYVVTAIAAQAADMGGWLFLGFPAAIYSHGLFGAWIAIGLVIFMYLNWTYIAPRLRTDTEKLNSLTLSSFFAARFNDKKGTLRVISALFSVLFFTFYIASGVVGLGRLFYTAFGLDYHISIIVGLSLSVLYALIGGFMAVAWSNLIQGLFLLVVIIAVPFYGYSSINGIQSIINIAQAKGISLALYTGPESILPALNLLAWGLGYFGQPHIITYFMGIDDVRKIKYATYVGMAWQITVLGAATIIGLIGIAFFPLGLDNPELLFMNMTKILFPSLIVGFVFCAILAAIFSTLNSQILLSGSVIAEDLYAVYVGKALESKKAVLITRMGALITALIALAIAWSDSNSVFDLVSYAWSGLGSAFGPVVIGSLYSSNITHNAALIAMITGGAVSALWPIINVPCMSIVPGFFSGLIIMYLISYRYPNPTKIDTAHNE